MLRVSLSLALLLGACSSNRQPVTEPQIDPPPGGSSEEAHDPVRQDYRLVLAQCDDQERAMDAQLTDAQRRRRRQTVAAAAAYALGEATDVRDDTDVPLDGMGGSPDCPRDRDPNRAGPCVTPTPTVGTNPQPSPAASQEDEVRSEALIRLESIDGAIDETDQFLFANPQPQQWTDADRAEWTARRNRLAQLCGYSATGPTGPGPAPEGDTDSDHRFDEAE